MKVRIEGAGHVVEIEGSALDHTLPQVTEIAGKLWQETRVVEPRQQMGFGSQLIERSDDRPVQGSGSYETKPVTS